MNGKWIYTYDYAPNQIWEPWRTSSGVPEWICEEAQNVSQRVKDCVSEDTLSFLLLTDSHYTVNGTWADTREAIRQLHGATLLEGVIHLGDFTDGMVKRELTKQYAGDIFRDFAGIGLSCYAALGNHDCNYFKKNPDRLTLDEQCALYLNGRPPRYTVNYDKQKLRLIFIDSYDVNEALRYGFSPECIAWLDQTLAQTPSDWCAILFSHVPPLVRLQAWVSEIRNRVELMAVLNKRAEKILAFINGHNHCDLLFNDLYNGRFPVISINCAKCEFFLDHKPEGAVVPYRELGNRNQESFDVMTINAAKREMHFTRFGAGQDRTVKGGKAEWTK